MIYNSKQFIFIFCCVGSICNGAQQSTTGRAHATPRRTIDAQARAAQLRQQIENDQKIAQKDKGEKLLAVALESNNKSLVKAVQKIIKETPDYRQRIQAQVAMISAINNNDVRKVHDLLAFGANPNGWKYLFDAYQAYDDDMQSVIFEIIAPDTSITDEYEFRYDITDALTNNPLQQAVLSDAPLAIFEELVQAPGININARPRGSPSTFEEAVKHNRPDIVQYLGSLQPLQPSHLVQLPEELTGRISSFLSPHDVGEFRRTAESIRRPVDAQIGGNIKFSPITYAQYLQRQIEEDATIPPYQKAEKLLYDAVRINNQQLNVEIVKIIRTNNSYLNQLVFNAVSSHMNQGTSIGYLADKNFNPNGWHYLQQLSEPEKLRAQPLLQELTLPNAPLQTIKESFKNPPLIQAILEKSAPLALALISHPKINVNIQDNQGSPVIGFAILANVPEIYTALITHPNTDINIQSGTNQKTPLILAVENNVNDAAALLLDQPKINVNAKDRYGKTALMYAALNRNKALVIKLLKHPSIDVTLQSVDGKTAASLVTNDPAGSAIAIMIQKREKEQKTRTK